MDALLRKAICAELRNAEPSERRLYHFTVISSGHALLLTLPEDPRAEPQLITAHQDKNGVWCMYDTPKHSHWVEAAVSTEVHIGEDLL